MVYSTPFWTIRSCPSRSNLMYDVECIVEDTGGTADSWFSSGNRNMAGWWLGCVDNFSLTLRNHPYTDHQQQYTMQNYAEQYCPAHTHTCVPYIILKTCLSCRWLDSPRAFNSSTVDGMQQVFWLIAPDIQPSQFIENQWLSRFRISDCESQQRDCAGISPASLHWMRFKGSAFFESTKFYRIFLGKYLIC